VFLAVGGGFAFADAQWLSEAQRENLMTRDWYARNSLLAEDAAAVSANSM
jgi:hypothetical protein